MSTRTALACSAALLLTTTRSAPTTSGSNGPTSPPATPSVKPDAAATPGAAPPGAAMQSGRQTIDGIEYYYELHGVGEPLLLLHRGPPTPYDPRGSLAARRAPDPCRE